jgi:hypothetical protein
MTSDKAPEKTPLDAELEALADKWNCAEWLDPDSKGPFKDGDAKYNRDLDEAQVYFRGTWWERGSFLMGRVSALEEGAEDLRDAAAKAEAFCRVMNVRVR